MKPRASPGPQSRTGHQGCPRAQDGCHPQQRALVSAAVLGIFSWGLEGGRGAKRFLTSPAEAKTSPSPRGSALPPPLPKVMRHARAF